jgi:Type II intron maturase
VATLPRVPLWGCENVLYAVKGGPLRCGLTTTDRLGQRARFLGYDIHVQHADTKISNGQRRANGSIALKVPPDVIRAQCARYRQHGKPCHRRRLQNLDDYDIVRKYGAEYSGVVNYYLLAQDVYRLRTLRWNAETSMLKTLAIKHHSTVTKIAALHKAKIETSDGLRTCFEARKHVTQPMVPVTTPNDRRRRLRPSGWQRGSAGGWDIGRHRHRRRTRGNGAGRGHWLRRSRGRLGGGRGAPERAGRDGNGRRRPGVSASRGSAGARRRRGCLGRLRRRGRCRRWHRCRAGLAAGDRLRSRGVSGWGRRGGDRGRRGAGCRGRVMGRLLHDVTGIDSGRGGSAAGQQRRSRHRAQRPSSRHTRPAGGELHMLLLEVTIRPTGGDTRGPAKSCAVRAATFCTLRPYKHERG